MTIAKNSGSSWCSFQPYWCSVARVSLLSSCATETNTTRTRSRKLLVTCAHFYEITFVDNHRIESGLTKDLACTCSLKTGPLSLKTEVNALIRNEGRDAGLRSVATIDSHVFSLLLKHIKVRLLFQNTFMSFCKVYRKLG